MLYLLSIYGSESARATATPADMERELDAYWDYERDVRGAGAHVAGHALQPTSEATTVRVRDGERLVTDGPFAETKEQLGGFYLVDCKDLDEAIEWAAKIPGATSGSIEVRPVMTFEAPDDVAQMEQAAGT